MELAVPRDREGRFEPQLVEKWVRRLPGFDEKVISLYARGMTTREIQAHVEELYGVTVSRELVSKVTDAVHEELQEWRLRPLEAVYPIVYFDALRVKIREEGLVQNKAVHLAMREPERHGAAGGADAGPLPERPGGGEADLPDAAEDRGEAVHRRPPSRGAGTGPAARRTVAATPIYGSRRTLGFPPRRGHLGTGGPSRRPPAAGCADQRSAFPDLPDRCTSQRYAVSPRIAGRSLSVPFPPASFPVRGGGPRPRRGAP